MHVCYMCDEKATTRDHVPPKVFFPEEKDLGAEYGDLRKNLVTVPACAQHNNACSKDDEYVACIIAMSESNEAIGADHFATKIARTLSRRSGLRSAFAASMLPLHLDGSRSAGVIIERDRFERVIDRIARGLYVNDTHEKLLGPLVLDCPALRSPVVKSVARRSPPPLPTHAQARWVGDRRVFEYLPYQFELEPLVVHMRFYGGFDVVVRRSGHGHAGQ